MKEILSSIDVDQNESIDLMECLEVSDPNVVVENNDLIYVSKGIA